MVIAEDEAPASPCIKLDGNPTTGYFWMYEVDRPDVLDVAETYMPDEAPRGKLGVGGEYTYLLSGISEGWTTVTFTYARGWENRQPVETLVCYVKVDRDLNVTILETSSQN